MAQLCHAATTFQSLGARVVLLSFGSPADAARWLHETCAQFPIWLDPKRRVYRAYGLQRSLIRSWNPRTLRTYAQLLLSGRRWRGIQGDSGQLGGDFIVDASGVIRFAYRSYDPTDRPSVEVLIQALSEVKGAVEHSSSDL